jgi:hypothetical protein
MTILLALLKDSFSIISGAEILIQKKAGLK